MSKETMKRNAEISSELLATKIHGHDDKKIKKVAGCSGSQREAARGASGKAPINPADPTK